MGVNVRISIMVVVRVVNMVGFKISGRVRLMARVWCLGLC